MAVEGKVEQKIEIFIVVCDLQTRKYCQYLSLIILVQNLLTLELIN